MRATVSCRVDERAGATINIEFYEVASGRMDATEKARREARERARLRFATAVTASAPEVRLDVAAFCIAAHAHPGLDIDGACTRLDELAARCPMRTFDG